MPKRLTRIFVVTAASLLVAERAPAPSHLWRFNEFYSSPDRSVQFIEMREIAGSEIETQISNHWFATDSFNQNHSQLLGYDLPPGTAFKKFLVGSQSYAALEGVPEPDYVLPDGFLDPTGDTVVWWFYQTIVIPPGVMPSDGYQSITVVNPSLPSYSVAPNTPTNFAGETGTIQPTVVPAISGRGLLATALALGAAAGWLVRRRTLRVPRS